MSESHQPRRLDLLEWLRLLAGFARLITRFSWDQLRFILYFRRFSKRAASIQLTRQMSVVDPRLLQAFMPTTGTSIRKVCTTKGLAHTEIALDHRPYPSGRLHLIGSKPASSGKVLLYFHGGGYLFPTRTTEVEQAIRYADRANAQLAMLEYTLSPAGAYPTQLIQAVTAVNHLLATDHTPSDIVFGGLSAGGNVSFGLLAHAQRPEPTVPSLNLDQSDKFGGVFALSPRCAVGTSADSFRRNASKDIMSVSMVKEIIAKWRPKDEVWASPVNVEPSFWTGIKVDRLLVAIAGDEVYLDDAKTTADRIKEGSAGSCDVSIVVCPGEFHGEVREDGMTKTLLQWLDEKS